MTKPVMFFRSPGVIVKLSMLPITGDLVRKRKACLKIIKYTRPVQFEPDLDTENTEGRSFCAPPFPAHPHFMRVRGKKNDTKGPSLCYPCVPAEFY